MKHKVGIHPTAIVAEGARLGDGVEIGPFCIVGARVQLGAGCRLHSHVVVDGRTAIGPGCRLFPFASIGLPPQDLKYDGEPSRLEIGGNTVIREHVTINPGTRGGGMLTRVGRHCLLMVGAHVAHDCVVGDHAILSNNATLAGHVTVGNHAIIGGLSAIHQFVRVGDHAMVGGMSGIGQDIIPYGLAAGNRAHLCGLNIVGLKRHGFSREDIHSLRAAYRLLFTAGGSLDERVSNTVGLYGEIGPVRHIVDFIRTRENRTISRPRNAPDDGAPTHG